jgi:gliding motility-associated lipoprotein GldJ
MKLKPIYPIALAMLTLAFTACDPRGPKMQSSTTGQMYNDPKWGGMGNFDYKGQETGPGLVLVEGGSFTMGNLENDLMYDHNTSERTATVHSFYMDETEVSNQQYREFEYWYQRVFDPNVAFFNGTLDFAGRSFDPNANGGTNYLYYLILPDTNCWRSKLGYNEPFVEYYYRHPAYKDYPVVGVNWHQAREFAKWRTDRVNEYILDREGIMCFNVGNDYLIQNPNDNFNTRAYLAGQDNGVFSGQPGQGPAVAGQSIKPANDNMLGSKPLRNYKPAKRKDQDIN